MMGPGNTSVASCYDAVVVGAGPNGLAAAIALARKGAAVLVVEEKDSPGGGLRTRELTLPGFFHDVCAAVHPLAQASPFLSSLPLREAGLEWIHPEVPLVHPLDHEQVVVQERSCRATAEGLGSDGDAYRRLYEGWVDKAGTLFQNLLAPFRLPSDPVLLARFGAMAVQPARNLAGKQFRTAAARALFAGHAAHSIMPLEAPGSAAYGLMLGISAHAVGWPIAKGGSGRIADALVSYLRSLGGDVVCGWRVDTVDELPRAKAYLFDVAPAALGRICRMRLPAGYLSALGRYRHGPGVCKVDWALSEAIPWANPQCARSATLHLGGTFDQIAASERLAARGHHAPEPYVILCQPSRFDPTRAPAGRHTAWAYCHVPNGSTMNVRDRIEAQIERHAPGFRECILDAHCITAREMELFNPNYVGGDIAGGEQTLWRQFVRPVARLNPYTTPAPDIFLCSASTPPGGGVHGMCGYFAARAAMRRL